MLNTCILTGNLGSDPTISYSAEGNPIANFSIAFNSSKSRTGWIKVTAFNKLAEIVQNYLHKGARIAVIGVLDHQTWEDDNGDKKHAYQVLANSIEFIKTDGRGFDNAGQSNKSAKEDEDLPF